MQGTLRKYVIVCNLLVKSTQCFPFELLLPSESRREEHALLEFESGFFLMCTVTECIKLVFGTCMQSEIVMKPILKSVYYSSSVYGYYALL